MPRGTLVDALRDPAVYRLAGGAVETRETHLSWVFLAGDRAYKLKKPVTTPFADYGTAAGRRAMCHEEVRLNRRLAADGYLGVQGVAYHGGAASLVSEDDPAAVEHLVVMRRFDEGATLAARLRDRRPAPGAAEDVGRVLAAFHAAAPREPGADERFADRLGRRFAVNAHETLALVVERAELGRIARLTTFAHGFVERHRSLLAARRRDGFVREGHGDLRAEHVVLADGRVQIVDCVEFDPALRMIDVADDLAFLVMDLVARGAGGVADATVEAYRAAGGDPGPEALIAFHAVYRALVRAKVALMRAQQIAAGCAAHGEASAAARDLVAVAERFAWRARCPLAIVVCGVPASGKSTLAAHLAAASGLPHLSSDVTRKRLVGLAADERAPAAAYDAAHNAATYTELGRRAAASVTGSGGVIVDATFRHRTDRDAFAAAFGAAAAPLHVECRVPTGELVRRARLRERDPARSSDADARLVAREATRFEPLDEVAAAQHLLLRADRPASELCDEVLAALDTRTAA